jgi:molybdopterin synthase catalytic subunit
MKIYLKPFAILREQLPESVKETEVQEGCTAQDLIAQLQTQFPTAAAVLACTRVASAESYVSKHSELVSGEEYALIPPVSGG